MGRVYLEEWCRKQGDYGIKLLSEWNQIRNGETTPFNTTFASNKKVWWKCLKCGYEWQAIIANRSKGKRGCPFCAGHIVIKGKNDFASIFPNIAKEWDDANADKPSDYSAGSNKIVWWKCEKCGYKWKTSIVNRTHGHGCGKCAGEHAIKIRTENLLQQEGRSFRSRASKLLKYWDYDKNEPITPDSISYGSNKLLWWKCEKGHQWQSPPSRMIKGIGCPICNRSMHTSLPEYAVFWYLRKALSDVQWGTHQCGWEVDVYVHSLKIGIEYDGRAWHKTDISYEREQRKEQDLLLKKGIKLIRIKESDLNLVDNNIIYYAVDNSYSNFDWMIEQLLAMLNIDKNISHSFNEDIKRINADYHKEFDTYKRLDIINPRVAEEWNYEKNDGLTPQMVTAGSHLVVWWRCSKCSNEWETSVRKRTERNQDCPICGRKKLSINRRKSCLIAGLNDFATVHPELLEEWDCKNTIQPDEITANSHVKVLWICSVCGYEWQASPHNRSNGRGCPSCAKEVRRKSRCIRVRNVDTGIEYDSLILAAKSCGLKSGGDTISRCCQGKQKTAGGYHWEYC